MCRFEHQGILLFRFVLKYHLTPAETLKNHYLHFELKSEFVTLNWAISKFGALANQKYGKH